MFWSFKSRSNQCVGKLTFIRDTYSKFNNPADTNLDSIYSRYSIGHIKNALTAVGSVFIIAWLVKVWWVKLCTFLETLLAACKTDIREGYRVVNSLYMSMVDLQKEVSKDLIRFMKVQNLAEEIWNMWRNMLYTFLDTFYLG